MRLDFHVAAVAIHRRRPAEDQIPAAAVEHRRADVACARIDRDRLARNARLKEGFGHPIWRPRFLRAGLEHQPDLQRNHGQPQRVHPRRVRGQHEPHHRTLHLIADRDAPLLAVPRRQHVERQAAGQRRENGAHLGQHERIFLHVRPAHPLGQPRARRLRPHELVGRLAAVAHRQRGIHIQLARLAGARHQLGDRNLAQHLTRPRRLAHVALNEPAVGAAHARDRLARREVRHLVDVDARVRLPPAQNGKVKHVQS